MRISRRGFTTIEVLAVIAIIGILSTLGVISYNKYRFNSRDSQRQSQATVISESLEKYYENNGEYPGCNSMTQSPTTISTNVLVGIDPSVFVVPNTTASNSVICNTVADSSTFGYVGDGSSYCASGTACIKYQLQYIEEATGALVTIDSRQVADVNTSDTIVLNPISAPNCTTGFTTLAASWNAISGAVSYTIDRDTQVSFNNSTGDFAESTSATNSATLTGLSPGKTYYVRVRANTSDGKYTFWSNVVNQTTMTTASVLTINTPTSTSLNASWTAANCAYQYTLERATDAGFTANVVDLNYLSPTLSTTVSGLSSGTTYYFRIKVTTAASGGYTSNWLSSGSGTTTVSIGTPPTCTAVNNGNNSVTINWGAASGASSYTVTLTGASPSSVSGVSALTYTWPSYSVAVGSQTYTVTATGGGTCTGSTSVTVTGYSTPGTIATCTDSTPSANNWSATWTSSSNASGYAISWSGSSSGAMGSTTTASLTYGTGVTGGQTITSVVNGYNTAFSGPTKSCGGVFVSGGATPTPTPTLPGACSNVTYGTVTSSSIAISWTAASGATSYMVYRDDVNFLGEIAGTSTTSSGLSSHTSYTFQIIPKNSAGLGTQCNSGSIKTYTNDPTCSLTATGAGQVTASWSASGATQYFVRRTNLADWTTASTGASWTPGAGQSVTLTVTAMDSVLYPNQPGHDCTRTVTTF